MVPQYTDLYVKNKKPGDPETALKMPYHQGDISSPLLLKVHLKNAQAVMYLFKRLFLMPEDKILWVSSEFGKSYKLHRYVLIDCLSGTTPPRFLTRKTFRQRFLSTPSPNVVHTDLAKGHHLEEDGPYQPPPFLYSLMPES